MIRTRFAPSPTGFLHIGSLRTALFAYLFAKKKQGSFILRIEDTDKMREVAGAKDKIIEDLSKLGIDADESFLKEGNYAPYIQSERLAIYQEKAKELLEKKYAYRCFCSPERLEKMRNDQKKQNLAPRYDGTCRRLSNQEIENNLKEKKKHTIRMKVKRVQGNYLVKDLLRGEVSFSSSQIDDQVILKSDGFPTYHLACVVDDYMMKISHVIRGEEWLPSTPKHLQLYEYFDWQPPLFVHLPLLLSTNRSKLSKRQGDVSVDDYLKKGFLKEALINFIALLGWNPGDNREIFSLQELKTEFSLERLGKSGAIFDEKKLQWMNQQYIKQLSLEELWEKLQFFLEEKYKKIEKEELKKKIQLIRDGLIVLSKINQELEFFNERPLSDENRALLKKTENKKIFSSFLLELDKEEAWQRSNFLQVMKKVQKETGIKGKKLWLPIRIVLTSQEEGPELPLAAEIFGKKYCLEKMKTALSL